MARSEVSRTPASTDDALARLANDVRSTGLGAGLTAVGVGHADVFLETRSTLNERRRAGLHAGMQFTYRNPDRSTDPGRVLNGARSLVVGARGYARAEADPVAGPRPGQGTVARYARHDHYADLRIALGRVADRIRADGWRTAVVVDDNALVDRAAAQRAGLGWFGRNTLLLLPGRGSWFVLGSVVTDAPLVPTAPAGPTGHAEGCGSCRRCITGCPTGALDDGVLDARRCLAWLVQAAGTFPMEHRVALGARIYGCDDCQTVCPINRLGDRRHRPADPEPDTIASVDLLDLLAATDEELLDAHGRWYVAERDPRYLRRNALVALGNVGDGADPATAAALSRWVAGDDELLAEHARWAAGRLGRDDLATSGTGGAR